MHRKSTTLTWIALAAAGLVAAGSPARAEDPKPAPAGGPVAPGPAAPGPAAGPAVPVAAAAAIVVATDAEAAAAIETFKEEFKAKGLTGDDRLAQRDFAMSRLAKVHHPAVVDSLGAVSRNGDPLLRTLAVVYLGEQRALPGLAGAHVLAAAKRSGDDRVLFLSALQSIGRLRYLGARDLLRGALQHQDYAVKKVAILTVGDVGDLRMLGDLMKVVGLDLEREAAKEDAKTGSGAPEVVTEGYSWDGVDVEVDTGTAGDGDQRAAEALGQAQLAANQAAAAAAAGAGGSGNGSGVTGGGGKSGGGSSRSPEELLPNLLGTLQRLTGQKFKSPAAVAKWKSTHAEAVAARVKKLDGDETAQKDHGKK